MTLIAFAIYDAKLDQFMPPFFLSTRPQAIRAFGDHVNTKGEPINRHAEDYSLHELGTFDPETGKLEAIATVKLIAKAIDHLEESNQLNIDDAINRKLASKRSA